MGRRLALLVATYSYQDTGLRRLTAPAHDAEALAAVLADPEVAGFEVTTLINEPHHVVGQAIGDFYHDRRHDDLTLLYFTGHGLKDDEGRLYLAMTDTARTNLLFTALPAEHVDRAMEGCVSRQKVLVLDCCYSGAFPAGHLAKADTAVHTLERFQGRGRTVLTASDATQYSFEGDRPHGQATQSVFTHHLVAGLRDGSADLDGDGDITLDELYSYVHDRVVAEMPQQRPKKQDNVEGRTIIARNVNWTLPAYLRNAINSPIAADRLAALDGLAHLRRVGNKTVRTQVLEELRRLADDDSKLVSAAAAQLVAEATETTREPAPPTPEATHEPQPPTAKTHEPAPPTPAAPRLAEEAPETPHEPTPSTPNATREPVPAEPETARKPEPLTPDTTHEPEPSAPEVARRVESSPETPPQRPRPVVPLRPAKAGTRAPRAGRTVRKSIPYLAAALVTALVITVVVLWSLSDKSDSGSGGGSKATSPTVLSDFGDAVKTVEFSADGKTLVATSGTEATVWNVGTGQLRATIPNVYATPFSSPAISPDGTKVAVGSADSIARLWDIPTMSLVELGSYVGSTVMEFNQDGTLLAVASTCACNEDFDNPVVLWDPASGQQVRKLSGHTNGVQSMAFSPDGTTLAAGAAGDTRVKLWNVDTGEVTATLDAGYMLMFSPDGMYLATSGDFTAEKKGQLWDLATRQVVTTLPKGDPIAFSPDGTALLTSEARWEKDTPVEVSSVPDGRYLPGPLVAPPVAFLDSTTIAITGGGSTVRLWDRTTGTDARTFTGHTDVVNDMELSPDGKTFATASDDRTVRLWPVS